MKDSLEIMKLIDEKYVEKDKLKTDLISIIKTVEAHKDMCSDYKKVRYMEGLIDGIKAVIDRVNNY